MPAAPPSSEAGNVLPGGTDTWSTHKHQICIYMAGHTGHRQTHRALTQMTASSCSSLSRTRRSLVRACPPIQDGPLQWLGSDTVCPIDGPWIPVPQLLVPGCVRPPLCSCWQRPHHSSPQNPELAGSPLGPQPPHPQRHTQSGSCS